MESGKVETDHVTVSGAGETEQFDSEVSSFSGEPGIEPDRPGKPNRVQGVNHWPKYAGIAGIAGLMCLSIILFALGQAGTGPLSVIFASPRSQELGQKVSTVPTVVTADSRKNAGVKAAASVSPTRTKSLTPTVTYTATITPTPTITFTPTITMIPQAGTVRMNQKDGMEQVFVPAGEFSMGCAGRNGGFDCKDNELPLHRVMLDAFWMDRTEVTNAMFGNFVRTTGYQTEAEKYCTGWVWTGFNWDEAAGIAWNSRQGRERYPVELVSWNDALAYCQWAEKDLPTEAQWEKAARGTDERTYPWGNDKPGCGLTNFDPGNFSFCVGDTSLAGNYPAGASMYGALDMAGNAWEWVADWYSAVSYYSPDAANNPTGPVDGKKKVVRGGSWGNTGTTLRLAYRSYNYEPEFRSQGFGFRCVSPQK